MDSSQIELKGSEIESITQSDSTIRIDFSRALIVKSMTGSKERTRWWQAGTLILAGVHGQPLLPAYPLRCAGGDLEENVYTYRDMIPIPLTSRGQIRCILKFEGLSDPLVVEASAVQLVMDGVAKYLEHLRP